MSIVRSIHVKSTLHYFSIMFVLRVLRTSYYEGILKLRSNLSFSNIFFFHRFISIITSSILLFLYACSLTRSHIYWGNPSCLIKLDIKVSYKDHMWMRLDANCQPSLSVSSLWYLGCSLSGPYTFDLLRPFKGWMIPPIKITEFRGIFSNKKRNWGELNELKLSNKASQRINADIVPKRSLTYCNNPSFS